MNKKIKLLILIFILTLPADIFGSEGKYFSVSVLSLYKPAEVSVYSYADEPVVLTIDGKPYYEYFITKGNSFDVRKEGDKIIVSVAELSSEAVKKISVSSSSSLGFSTQDTKSLYNKYAIKVRDDVKKDYEGVLEVTYADDSFLITLKAEREGLVRAITESEAGSYSEYEMLKVQSVLTRTFLYANEGRHKNEGFDFCDTTHCQFYKNGGAGSKKVAKAVEETKGEIITYNGVPISPYYFSTCGGHTTNISTVWGADDGLYPYIKPVECDHCSDSKFYRYQRRLDRSVLSKIFLDKDDDEFDIKVEKLDKNGIWVDTVTITATDHKTTLKADKFKSRIGRSLGWNELPSGSFLITKEGDRFLIEGNGLGHGVGLCQNGGNKMAGTRVEYKKIIAHYYYGVAIENIAGL